jgi:hypothetical protein
MEGDSDYQAEQLPRLRRLNSINKETHKSLQTGQGGYMYADALYEAMSNDERRDFVRLMYGLFIDMASQAEVNEVADAKGLSHPVSGPSGAS